MTAVEERLEYLRGELRAERISYAELAEIESLAEHIKPDDVELLEVAGVPEHHHRLRNILIEYGNPEFGDAILDDICELFGYPTTPEGE